MKRSCSGSGTGRVRFRGRRKQFRRRIGNSWIVVRRQGGKDLGIRMRGIGQGDFGRKTDSEIVRRQMKKMSKISNGDSSLKRVRIFDSVSTHFVGT